MRAEHPEDPALEFADLEPAAVAVNAFLSKAYNEKLNEELENVTRKPDDN